jgi:hypothetical protein
MYIYILEFVSYCEVLHWIRLLLAFENLAFRLTNQECKKKKKEKKWHLVKFIKFYLLKRKNNYNKTIICIQNNLIIVTCRAKEHGAEINK